MGEQEHRETLESLGEFGLIRRLSRGCLVRPSGVVLGIGDDAAALEPPPGELLLLTTDLLVEGVHFLRDRIAPEDLGHKALAVNLSDIAAMGGSPREALVGLGVPPGTSPSFLEALYEGMRGLASQFSVNILGGDTTLSRADLVISLMVTGHVPRQQMLRRSGAQTGDRLYCTGPLGESRAGLHLSLHEGPRQWGAFPQLMRAHRRPHPQVQEGRFMASAGGVHAAIDISDGLSSDVRHLAEASGVGVRLFAERIPLSEALQGFCSERGLDPLSWALAGGEDYVLLVAVDPERAGQLEEAFLEAFARPLHPLGEVAAGEGVNLVLESGEVRPLEPHGWEHFRSPL